MNRQQHLADILACGDEPWDFAIIGGGATGAGEWDDAPIGFSCRRRPSALPTQTPQARSR